MAVRGGETFLVPVVQLLSLREQGTKACWQLGDDDDDDDDSTSRSRTITSSHRNFGKTKNPRLDMILVIFFPACLLAWQTDACKLDDDGATRKDADPLQ